MRMNPEAKKTKLSELFDLMFLSEASYIEKMRRDSLFCFKMSERLLNSQSQNEKCGIIVTIQERMNPIEFIDALIELMNMATIEYEDLEKKNVNEYDSTFLDLINEFEELLGVESLSSPLSN